MASSAPPKGIRPAPFGKITPILWLCFCGQFNNVADSRCIACGGVK